MHSLRFLARGRSRCSNVSRACGDVGRACGDAKRTYGDARHAALDARHASGMHRVAGLARPPLMEILCCNTSGCCKSSGSKKQVTIENMNPNLIKLEYAVRGPLVIRAGEIEKELAKGTQKPFKTVVKANIGDAHAMGQPYITFIRQVLAAVIHPPLIKSAGFPEDVQQRATELLKACGGGSVGAYSQSHGIEMIRRHAAEYIERRDGIPAQWQDICLSSGASDAIKNVLKILIKSIDCKPPGIMIPIPQYPLYSATLAEFGMEPVGYYLDEDHNWALDIAELERSIGEAKNKINVRGLVAINPGNPTGQVLTRKNIEDVMQFAQKHNLLVLADEVYQENVYAEGSAFYSFKKVSKEMGPPCSEVELASFLSCSKGYMGECGLRGGYMEICNIDPAVKAHLFKAISAMLCPTILGQITMDCVVNPPKEGEPSYELWSRERCAVLRSLCERADVLVRAFNEMEGFKCNVVQGAMYAFPRIDLPPKAIEAAKKEGKTPDGYYAFKLLENHGICIVPGSGFGQRPGTYHFRTTILPQPDQLKLMLEEFKKFHEKFTSEHS